MVISKGNYPLKAGLNSCKLPAAGWTRMGGLNWRSCLGIWHESSGLIGASLIYFNIVPWNIKELPFEELSSATLKSALYHSLIGGFKHVLFSIYNVWDVILPIDEVHHFSRWIPSLCQLWAGRISKPRPGGAASVFALCDSGSFFWYCFVIWLMVWNMNFMTFHSVGNNNPNWFSYFSEG